MKRFGMMVAGMLAVQSVSADTLTEAVHEALGIFQANHLKIDDATTRRAVIQSIARTADPGAETLTQEDAAHRREELSGRDYSAGFRLTITNGLPVIIDVATNSPAQQAGLAAGDLLLATSETNPLDVVTLPEILAATRRHGPDTLALHYRSGKSASNTTAVKLELRNLPAIECAETLPNGIYYIKVNGLYAGGGEAIAEALRTWTASNRSGVIMDLRGATGDDLEGVKTVASLFAKSGDLLFSLRDRADQEIAVYKAAASKNVGVPVMAMVDHDTRGAAEALAAVLSDSVKGAMLVGRTSRGDPMIREYVKLQSGDLLYLATRQLVTAEGGRHDGKTGVKPDVLVSASGTLNEYDAEPVADRRQLLEQELQDYALRGRMRGDAALRRAVDILLGLKALNIGAAPSTMPAN